MGRRKQTTNYDCEARLGKAGVLNEYGGTKMEIEVKEIKNVEDGKHTGVISSVEYKESPYNYTDVYIKVDDTDIELKYGCPTSGSIKSRLMRLLANFTPIQPKQTVNPEEILMNRRVVFMTIKNPNTGFIDIVEGSVNPIK